MRVSVEILDHIFSFLVSHRETLIACSKHPVLSPIIERHLYYHIGLLINTRDSESGYAFEPEDLSKLVTENPRIANYVRILQIHLVTTHLCDDDEIWFYFDEAVYTLPEFPSLECIMLTSTAKGRMWCWSTRFQAVLEDRLSLPTVKELHLVGSEDFPFSLLDKCKNIKRLFLTGAFEAEGEFCDSPLPQLKSLTLSTGTISSSLWAWLKSHICELESLKCAPPSVEDISDMLGVCSGTLKKLDVDLVYPLYESHYAFRTGQTLVPTFLPNWTPAPSALQQLTIRAAIYLDYHDDGQTPRYCRSSLSAATDAINSFISSTRHLVLDIDLNVSTFFEFTEIDFAPLAAALGAASISIPHIDLYLRTGIFSSAVTYAQFMVSIEDYEDVVGSIKEGRLVVHSEKTIPDCELDDDSFRQKGCGSPARWIMNRKAKPGFDTQLISRYL